MPRYMKYNIFPAVCLLTVAVISFSFSPSGQSFHPVITDSTPRSGIVVGKNTPLMGWASWNNFRAEISESILKKQANAMISSGLAKAGYTYFNIDDGFFAGRDTRGNLVIDHVKFPKGMKDMADHIHSKGLKAGIYSEAGSNTCGSIWDAQTGGINAGMYTHDQKDANVFFKTWGYDYIKVDYCGGQNQALDEQERYTAIKNAILKTGRKDIQFNICRWEFPGTWAISLANSWRISSDLFLKWSSVMNTIDKNTFLAPYASSGHYNDMDMLQVGRGFSYEEDKTHFSLWCLLSSPLMLGNDMTSMNAQTLGIVTNREVIALNQDTTGLQAQLVKDDGMGHQVWSKSLNGKQSNERGVILFNRTETAARIAVNLNDIDLFGPAIVRDLWLHRDIDTIIREYEVAVPAHGVAVLKIKGRNKMKENFEAEYAYLNNFNHLKYSKVIDKQAKAVRDSTCSSLAKTVQVGNNLDNWMEFRDIDVPTAGNYRLTITYACDTDKTIHYRINQGQPMTITGLHSGGANKWATKTISVQLAKGRNSIRLFNPADYIPDIDKIHITFY